MARTVAVNDPMFGDKVAYLKDGWAVRYDGNIQAARFNDEGPAKAHLELLQEGYINPQPETRDDV